MAALIGGVLAAPVVANERPQVADVTAVVEPAEHRVVIGYDLLDAESDVCEVTLRVSADGGETFLVDATQSAGDVGFPVAPGPERQVIWAYDPARVSGASFVVKIVADDGIDLDIQEIVDRVDLERMRGDLLRLEGRRHYGVAPDNIAAAKDFIESEFVSYGLQAVRQRVPSGRWRGENIIGRWPGEIDEAKVYIIDGHFDTVGGTPGADDNASGTVGMLEAMRALSAYRFERSLKFIGFDLEEIGLVGSQRYVLDGIPEYEDTRGVINFEMIGYTCETTGCDAFATLGNYIHNISNVNSNSLRFAFDAAALAYAPGLEVLSTQADLSNPNFRRSDHARFWDVGIKALFLTDGANFRNPHYHQASDLVSTLDLEFMTNIVKTAVGVVAELAVVRHVGVGQSEVFAIPESTPVGSAPWSAAKTRYR